MIRFVVVLSMFAYVFGGPNAISIGGIDELDGLVRVPLTHRRRRAADENGLKTKLQNWRDDRIGIEVGIGTPPQKITLMFDTGSSDLWIVSQKAKDNITVNNLFDETASSTFKETPGDLFLGYIATSVNGTKAVDTLTIGSLTAKNQPMGVATVQVGPSINAPFDGTMGFAKAPLSETDNSTVVDRLYEQDQIKKRMACLKLHTQNEEKDSEMIIGGCDVEADYWLPVLGESYWAVTLTKIILRSPTDNTELLSLDVNVQAVLDTGDPNSLHLPERFVNPINDKLGGNWNGNHYIVDCDTRKSFPNMELYFGEAKITFTTDDYSWLYFGECQLALKPRTYDEVLVPLQFFFKATVILDSGNNRVGLANIK